MPHFIFTGLMLHHRQTTQLLRAFNITSRHSVRVARCQTMRCQPQNSGANTPLTCYIFIASQTSQHSAFSSLPVQYHTAPAVTVRSWLPMLPQLHYSITLHQL
ncbi:hypothetical protein ElyMa_003453500 [Elysia marginata]|uniref:Uncharacterized protein n=1 Tax=Elysia marginata TaxID=1093978 RepID=A0AAV4E8N1_9GAST|nr:hypothetical protein ElyMa_003453500 [Elysia marginata]